MRAIVFADQLVADLLDAPAQVLERHGDQIPELAALRGCPQPPNHHAEGDVWRHTELALETLTDLDAAVRRFAGPQLDAAGISVTFPPRTLTATVAVLLHDIGKPVTIAGGDGFWTYYGHESVGAYMAVKLLRRLRLDRAAKRAGTWLDVDAVGWLISQHLFWLNTDVLLVTDRAVARRFADHTDRGELLRVLNWCDGLGSRGPDGRPHVQTLVDAEVRIASTRRRIHELAARPKPLLDGRTVMETLDLESGPRVGAILRLVRQRFTDEALALEWIAANAGELRTVPLPELGTHEGLSEAASA